MTIAKIILFLILVVCMTIVPGLLLSFDKKQWMARANGTKEPHPLGPALIILGVFILVMFVRAM